MATLYFSICPGVVIIVSTSSCGLSGDACSPWKCRLLWFSQGPRAHCSLEWAGRLFRYRRLILPPGKTRMIGGTVLPLKENAWGRVERSGPPARVTAPRISEEQGRTFVEQKAN